jgi:hypothetical protein
MNILTGSISRKNIGLVVNPATMDIKFVKIVPVEEDLDSMAPNKSRGLSLAMRP